MSRIPKDQTSLLIENLEKYRISTSLLLKIPFLVVPIVYDSFVGVGLCVNGCAAASAACSHYMMCPYPCMFITFYLE